MRACCQANTSAEIITPLITAIARSVKIVITVTSSITSASAFGIRRKRRSELHSKVL
ncbi:hypothetical protein D3C75_1379360 [compost metagenome]